MGIRLTTVQFQVGAAKKVSTYPHDLAKSNSSILLLLKTENISLGATDCNNTDHVQK